MTLPQEFFTAASLGTFVGATGFVFVISNVLRRALGPDSRFIPICVGLIVAFVGAWTTGQLGAPLDVLVAFANGCLLCCTAGGATSAIVSTLEPHPAGVAKAQGKPTVKFLQRWF
jgi:hypothetical protein